MPARAVISPGSRCFLHSRSLSSRREYPRRAREEKRGAREENRECSGRQQELINGPSSLARKDHLIRQLPMKSESGDYLGHWNLCLLIIEACENNSCFIISNRPTSL